MLAQAAECMEKTPAAYIIEMARIYVDLGEILLMKKATQARPILGKVISILNKGFITFYRKLKPIR